LLYFIAANQQHIAAAPGNEYNPMEAMQPG